MKYECYLKDILERKGISQRDLAKGTGLNEVSISRYIKKQRVPSLHDAKKISDFLGVNVYSIWYFVYKN